MKDDGLAGHSPLYKEKSDVYEIFSQAEDSDGKIIEFIKTRIKGKVVLDFGCGTGKFIPELARCSDKVIGVDINESQLDIARKKIRQLQNAELFKSENDYIPLPQKSIDVIFATWVIGSIHDLELRAKILEEFKRVLKPGGKIYLIENDVGGEWKEITGGEIVNKRTIQKLEWLNQRGYQEEEKITMTISFKDLNEARSVLEVVWNKEAAGRVRSKNISVNLTILSISHT